MPSEWYTQGYNAGMASASANRDSLRYCYTTEDSSILAGEKLKEIEDGICPWYVHSQNWRVGFWDGFLARSDEFRK
jgi:hypothetical protein